MQQDFNQRQFSMQPPAINFRAQTPQKVQSKAVASVTGQTQRILDQLNNFVASQHTNQENSEKLQQRCSKQQQILADQRKQVQELRSERAKIEEHIRLQETGVQEVEVQANTYKTQFHALNKTLQDVKVKMCSGESKVDELAEWKDGVHARLAKLQEEVKRAMVEALSRTKDMQIGHQKDRQSLQVKVDELNTKVVAIERENKDLVADIESKRSKIDHVTDQMTRIADEKSSLKSMNEQLDRSYTQLREKEKALLVQLENKNHMLDDAKSELKELKRKFEQAGKERDAELKKLEKDANDTLTKMSEDHRAEKERLESQNQVLQQNAQVTEAVTKEKISHLNSSLQDRQEMIDSLKIKFEESCRASDSKILEIKELKSAQASYNSEFALYCAGMENLASQFSENLLAAHERSVQSQKEYQANTRFLEQQVNVAMSSAKDEKDRVSVLEEELQGQKDLSDKLALETRTLATTVAEKETSLLLSDEKFNERLKENIMKSQEYFSKCQSELKAQHHAELLQLKADRAELDQKIISAGKELETASLSLETARQESSKQQEQISLLKRELEAALKKSSSSPKIMHSSRPLVSDPVDAVAHTITLSRPKKQHNVQQFDVSSSSIRTPSSSLKSSHPRAAMHQYSDRLNSNSQDDNDPSLACNAIDGHRLGGPYLNAHCVPTTPWAPLMSLAEDTSIPCGQPLSQDPGTEKTVKKRKRTIDGPLRSNQASKKADTLQSARQITVGMRSAKLPVHYGNLQKSARTKRRASPSRKACRSSPKLSPADSERSIDLFSLGAC